MYAIFQDGGHQYKAEVGRKLYLELRDVEDGATLEFNEVLLISDETGAIVGQPTIAGAKIITEVVAKAKGPKLVIRWFRRRKNSRRKNGHRQQYVVVEVKEIVKG